MDPAALQSLAECLKTLPWWLASLLVVSLVIQQLLSWHTRKQERAHKDTRASRYVDTISGLTSALKEHEEYDRQKLHRIESSVTQVQVDLRKCLSAVDGLRLRSRGVMSAVASLRLIRSYYDIITVTVQRAVEQQIWEQGEGPPTEYTARKVRTMIATALSQIREHLRAIRQLSVPVSDFFPIYMEQETPEANDMGKERFFLVDALWNIIAPCFSSPHTNIQQQIEVVNLLIENAITDHLSGLIARYRKEHPDSFSGDCGTVPETSSAE